MAELNEWVPDGLDPTVPNPARAYDFVLGGGHNFESDRRLVAMLEQIMPGTAKVARINRSFLKRAVRHMLDAGIRQFLDIGSGVPTVGNLHEIAERSGHRCKVLYVDKDPIAVAHSELLLADHPDAGVLQADMRDPDSILAGDPAQNLLDFNQPIGVLFLLMLHWVPDRDDPLGLVRRYRDALTPGSYLAISHMTTDFGREVMADKLTQMLQAAGSKEELSCRSPDQIREFFTGFDIIEPGLVGVGTWHAGPGDFTDDPHTNNHAIAGLGRKR